MARTVAANTLRFRVLVDCGNMQVPTFGRSWRLPMAADRADAGQVLLLPDERGRYHVIHWVNG
jgi:hypothetical protein